MQVRIPELTLRMQRRIAYLVIALGCILGIWRDATTPEFRVDDGHVLDGIRARGELVVLTRNAPTTFYYDQNGEPAGYEFELVEDFANSIGVQVRFVIEDTVSDILQGITAGEGDIAAAGLTRTTERMRRYRFGPSYKRIRQQLVCNRTMDYPRSMEDLPGHSIEVIANSSYEETLVAMARRIGELTYQATVGTDTEGILARVAVGEVECTIADSNIVAVNRRYEPDLIVPFDMTEGQELAWVLPPGAQSLSDALSEWFAEVQETSFLDEIDERYYGHVEEFDYVDLRAFEQRISSRLPELRAWFERAGEGADLPWTLLAAVGYQESHWDTTARSPTGVRGVMMLTLATAEDLGVENRLDPEESIMGGGAYLRSIYDRLPETITGEDRLYIALASYNVGLGHVLDARQLAEQRGLDPNTWRDLREVLPLLAQRTHYRNLRYGYARGGQAAIYVQQVRDYWDILNRTFPSHSENTGSAFNPPPPTAPEVAEPATDE